MRLTSESWYSGLQYNVSKRVFASATYRQTILRSRNGYAEANPGGYQKGQYLAANFFYNVTDNMQLGIEYLHGWRMDFNDKTYNANRINLSARYDF
jgi:opacity protein-like surface antigen